MSYSWHVYVWWGSGKVERERERGKKEIRRKEWILARVTRKFETLVLCLFLQERLHR